MMPETIYVARLPCGCVIESCPVWDDETDITWLYRMRGNGWAVSVHSIHDELVETCEQGTIATPLTTRRMFA